MDDGIDEEEYADDGNENDVCAVCLRGGNLLIRGIGIVVGIRVGIVDEVGRPNCDDGVVVDNDNDDDDGNDDDDDCVIDDGCFTGSGVTTAQGTELAIGVSIGVMICRCLSLEL